MRGIGGAAIIGIPLLYTQETWNIATTFGAHDIFWLLIGGAVLCVGYNAVSGFRKDGGLVAAVRDAVEALAIGAVLATVLSFLLGVVDTQMSLAVIASKIAVETVPLALGASVANTQFGGDKNKDADKKGDGTDEGDDSPRSRIVREAGITVAGAMILGASIAPTEEVALIAERLSALGIVGVALFSLSLSYGMIFVADFSGAKARREEQGILQSPMGETILAYAVSFAVSFLLIQAFHGVEIAGSPYMTIALTVSLALPATTGGALGRLII